MSHPTYAADCDLVIELEKAGVGIEEILQYAHGVLSEKELRALIRGLTRIVEKSDATSDAASDIASDIATATRALSTPPSRCAIPSPPETRTV